MNKLLKIILLTFILASCTDPSSQQEWQTIKINPSEAGTMDLSQAAEELFYVPLETGEGFFIGRISKVLFHDGLIYVLDSWINKAVYIFNEKGRFLRKINDKGDGPGEFREPCDMAINRQAQALLVFDQSHKKILEYNLQGTFTREWFIDLDFHEFICLDHDVFALYTNNKYNYWDKDQDLSYQVLIYRPGKGIINRSVPNQAALNHGNPSFSFNREFFSADDKVYINWALHDTIYEIKGHSLHPRFVFDFGRHTIPAYEKKDIKKLIDKINDRQYGCVNSAVFHLRHELFFKCNLRGKSSYALYDIDTGELIYFRDIINDIDDGIFNIPVTTWDNSLVIINYPEAYYENAPGGPPVLKGCSREIKPFDNPVLMIVKLKPGHHLKTYIS